VAQSEANTVSTRVNSNGEEQPSFLVRSADVEVFKLFVVVQLDKSYIYRNGEMVKPEKNSGGWFKILSLSR